MGKEIRKFSIFKVFTLNRIIKIDKGLGFFMGKNLK